MRSHGTQTEGLFFKSARALENETKAEIQAKFQREAGRDRRLQLTTYSPGRGFWRQQVDHMCSHLKAYAQNSQDFQKAIGQAQMGKVNSNMYYMVQHYSFPLYPLCVPYNCLLAVHI
jgi:hypothetical protein